MERRRISWPAARTLSHRRRGRRERVAGLRVDVDADDVEACLVVAHGGAAGAAVQVRAGAAYRPLWWCSSWVSFQEFTGGAGGVGDGQGDGDDASRVCSWAVSPAGRSTTARISIRSRVRSARW